MPATTVAVDGDTSIRKSVTIGIGFTVAVTVDPLLNVTVALFPMPEGATVVGVTTMLTVAVPFTANVPIAHVTAAGVPVAPVHDPGEAVALVKVVPVPGRTSLKFTLNAGSGPVLVIVYLKVRAFPTPTVGGEGTPTSVRVLTAPILVMKASLVPFRPAWKGFFVGKSPEAVCPAT